MKVFLFLAGLCSFNSGAATQTYIKKLPFGEVNHVTVSLYTLKNSKGMEVQLTDFGARVVSIKIPGQKRALKNVVLTYQNLQGFVDDTASLGATIGRYANRIGTASFSLNKRKYSLDKNNGSSTLHGGSRGFSKALWETETIDNKPEPSVRFKLLSPNGDQGFPGTVTVHVEYTLLENNELKIQYKATTDAPTVINLTNHTYFNLSDEKDVLKHKVALYADEITLVDKEMIPTGEIKAVQGSVFDFRKPKSIGKDINADDPQIKLGNGFDHNWVLKKSEEMKLAAKAVDCVSGRTLEVWTTEPGIQFYTGNFLGRPFRPREGFCLETQHFPDSPNKPQFPSTELKPGDTFTSTTIFKFTTSRCDSLN